jgi:hypothetical protein
MSSKFAPYCQHARGVGLMEDGKTLVVGTGGQKGFRLVDVATGNLLNEKFKPTSDGYQTWSAAVSLDGNVVAVGLKDIRIWALKQKDEEP